MAVPIDIESLLRTLSLEEKISLLSGQGPFETRAIPGKVPSVKVSDGPNGARGAGFVGTVSAACFPAASCLAATFNADLARRVGEALGEEADSKGVRCLLAPTVCNHRHPLGGRNFESFSEDPLLTGILASQVVQGIQSKGISATIKHFVGNEQETERKRVNTLISERALREIYLHPFEITVKEAKPWAVMTAYNKLNDEHCDSSKYLLKRVLRGEWGWDGLVMSDWGGTNSSAGSINAGVELEMPGPGRFRTVPAVLEDIEKGRVSETTIDGRVCALLRFLERVGAFQDSFQKVEQEIDKEEHRQLIREVSGRGAVLLKNNGILPLSKAEVSGKRVALFGFAKTALAHGGGSAAVKAFYKVTPWAALQEAYGGTAEITYAKGAHTDRFLPPVTGDGKGRIIEFVADLTPLKTGPHYFGISGVGRTQLFVDENLVYEQPGQTADEMGFIFGLQVEGVAKHTLIAGTVYRVRIRTMPGAAAGGLKVLAGRPGFRFGMAVAAEHDADLLAEAVNVAKDADYAIVFTGHTEQWETEGQDQVSFNLPMNGSQDMLVSAVAAVNPTTIVVNSTGVPVAMPWVDSVAAVVQAWFGGQEAGASIADVLTGAVNPEGHLPVTFPKKLEDAPAYDNFPGTYVEGHPTVKYEEDIFVGYRHYDRLPKDKVNFPFGHGLSYSTFDYNMLKPIEKHEDQLSICVRVKNTSSIAGGTLVQIYAGPATLSPSYPVKSLVGFARVMLEPGESQTVTLSIALRHLAYFDEQINKWVVRAGSYLFTLGRSVADPIETAILLIEKELVYGL
ncbi:glycoside hydrolase superfamily [Aspergillus granulosus]|uniref:beta-glucosidase n=1 Tax=Aspergillus granulosus TaxID=176169 RepID=A0ABR4HP03_9EURO